jgi:hypothetical protein
MTMTAFENEDKVYYIKNYGRFAYDDENDGQITKELKRQSKPKKQVVEHNVSQKYSQQLKNSRR